MGTVGAVVLAAGGSKRLGQPKQLVRIDGESLVRRAVVAARDGGCGAIVVIAGELMSEIERESLGTPAVVIHNADWRRGVGTSIATCVRAIAATNEELQFVMILACDQPFVSGEVVRALIDAQRTSGKPIVASTYANTIGIPALFDRSCFAALVALSGDAGAKRIIESRRSEVAIIPFEAGAIDIDTPADLQFLTQ